MTGPPAAERRDDSAERTRLAWWRTALAGAIVGLLIARPAVAPQAGAGAVLLAAAGMSGWTVLMTLTYRRTRGLVAVPPPPGRGNIPAYAWITVGFAVLGGLVVLL
jgi:hypothetical protein